jgi:acyl-CoA dehydrogenase family member 9
VSPSFTEEMVGGRLRADWLLPYPSADPEESAKVDALTSAMLDYCAEAVDSQRIEDQGWIGDDLVRCFAERGLMGLGIPQSYGGQGLSMTGYCRMFEALGGIDPALALVIGIHQSIGTRGIVEYGSEEQKERFLPDLASARRLAAFALTEPSAGSDAYNIRTRAVRQPDGSWRLNGEKCFIGNGDKGSVFVTFARTEVDGRDRHVALIVEKGMDGFECGERYRTMGLCANDVRPLYFKDVRVPPENVLGAPGEGFRIAQRVLQNGRLTIAAGNVGCMSHILDLVREHVTSREAFGSALSDFGLVQEKVARMATQVLVVKAMTYLTTGFVDDGALDSSIEIAMCKINATDFVVEAANRALDLRGGAGYMASEPYEKILRDVRVFPIFEGSNDVLRPWIALKAFGSVVERMSQNGSAPPPARSGLPELAGVEDQVERIAEATKSLLVEFGEDVRYRQLDQHRLADALTQAFAQAAVLSYTASGASEREQLMAESFCTQAGRSVH